MTVGCGQIQNFHPSLSPYLSTAIWSPQNRACYYDGRQVHQPPPVLGQHFYENGGAKELWEWALECPESSPPQPPSLNLSKYRNWRSKITKTNNSPLREKKSEILSTNKRKGHQPIRGRHWNERSRKRFFERRKKTKMGRIQTAFNIIGTWLNFLWFSHLLFRLTNHGFMMICGAWCCLRDPNHYFLSEMGLLFLILLYWHFVTDCRHPNHKGWLSVLPEDSKSSQGQLDCGLGAGPVGDDWLPIGDRVVTRWHRWPIARPSGGYREPRGSGGNVDPIHWIPPGFLFRNPLWGGICGNWGADKTEDERTTALIRLSV